MSGGQERLKSSAGNFLVAFIPGLLPMGTSIGGKLVDLNVAVTDHGVVHVVESAKAKMDFIRGEIPIFTRFHILENILAVHGSTDLAGLKTKLEGIDVAVEFGRTINLMFCPALRKTGNVALVIVSFYPKGVPTPGFRLRECRSPGRLERPGWNC